MRIGPHLLLRRETVSGGFWPDRSGFFAGLRTMALAERQRWPLWLPVLLGAGAGLYFAWPAEPPVWLGWALALLSGASAVVAVRSHQAWARAGLALVAALTLGFGAAKLREARVAAPVLEKPMVAHLTGRIVALDWGQSGLRIILDQVRSGRLPDPPARVRLLVFARIGATGFAYGAPTPVPLARPLHLWERLPILIEDLRAGLTRRIRAELPESQGAIASAIITGERGGIAPEDEAALRDAGLAHVLAIAGLHMALVGAGLFWLARALLAAVPVLALSYPIKKWAALLALAGAGFYIVISGGAPSALRAFVMLAMMLLAVLLDRPALSMRSLGLAAAILLLARPEAVTEPGFQMSFAAVAGLVAVAEWEAGRPRLARHGWLYRHLRGIALTSLVASLATTPFALFYFGRATHYAVLGNLMAMPVMGLVTMPAAALSVAAMPFGLEHLPLRAMGWSIGWMLRLGGFVSGLPGAVTMTPAFPLSALVLVSLGGLWVLLWRRRWRWLGLAPLLAGMVVAWNAPKPDLLVGGDAQTVALRGTDGRLDFPLPPKDRFAASRWLLRDGDARDWPDAVGEPSLRCDGWGCVSVLKGRRVALALRPEALQEDCARADIVISAWPASSCTGPLVLDGPRIAAEGGYAVTLSPLHVIGVNGWRGARPWTHVAQRLRQ
ncbi:MAG: ComEC/Rec2 family competence protein [Alphaproteobacteria bacterium]|nr:ComEC/Rec2 family competence protein [Alphaproteobacteria bacterium]